MWGSGPCDFSVSPSPFGLDSGTSDSGLTTATLGFASFTKFNNFVQFIFEKKKLLQNTKIELLHFCPISF